MRQRDGHIVTVVEDNSSKSLQAEVHHTVKRGSTLCTDAWSSYRGLAGDFDHQVIDHAEKYVDGRVQTNGIENFWSLLKRGLNGTYVSVEPFHLFRYLDERVFTFNHRENTDLGRFATVLGGARVAG